MNDKILALAYSGAMSYAIYKQSDSLETALAVFLGLSIMLYLVDQKFTELKEKMDEII